MQNFEFVNILRRLAGGDNTLNICVRIGTERASVACCVTSTGITLLPAAAADSNQQSSC